MNKFPLFAALDIGSNAARMLFANVVETDTETVVLKNSLMRLPLRLGSDVYEKGIISVKKTQALIETINVFKTLIKINKPIDYAIFATSALREATNSSKVIDEIQKATSLNIEIIDGIEEARLIKELYSNQGSIDDYKLFADLGGGSLELTVLKPDGTFESDSYKIGAVRALSSGISPLELKRMYDWLNDFLPEDKHKLYFVGTGGNVNTLKKTFSNKTETYIKRKRLSEMLEILQPLSVLQRISNFKLRPDRADVIVPAIEILLSIMNKFKIEKVYVPGGGLSDAIILQLYKNSRDKKLKT